MLNEKKVLKNRKKLGAKRDGPHTSLGVYDNIRKSSLKSAQSREELSKFIAEGQRPFYGFPHMNFGTTRTEHEDEKIEGHTRNWKAMSRAILKKQ